MWGRGGKRKPQNKASLYSPLWNPQTVESVPTMPTTQRDAAQSPPAWGGHREERVILRRAPSHTLLGDIARERGQKKMVKSF